jgi:hypothetical protein
LDSADADAWSDGMQLGLVLHQPLMPQTAQRLLPSYVAVLNVAGVVRTGYRWLMACEEQTPGIRTLVVVQVGGRPLQQGRHKEFELQVPNMFGERRSWYGRFPYVVSVKLSVGRILQQMVVLAPQFCRQCVELLAGKAECE